MTRDSTSNLHDDEESKDEILIPVRQIDDNAPNALSQQFSFDNCYLQFCNDENEKIRTITAS